MKMNLKPSRTSAKTSAAAAASHAEHKKESPMIGVRLNDVERGKLESIRMNFGKMRGRVPSITEVIKELIDNAAGESNSHL